MSRIELIPDSKLGWLLRSMKRYVHKKLGLDQPSDSINLMAHHKGVLFAFTAFMGSLDRWDRLPTRLKRLVHLRVAMRVGCPF